MARKPKPPPGSRWRVLAHGDGGKGWGHHVQSHPNDTPLTAGLTEDQARRVVSSVLSARQTNLDNGGTEQVLPGTVFDELVVDDWLHIEQMDTDKWSLHIAGFRVAVRVNRDGTPAHVLVEGPDEFAGPVPGCAYVCHWSREDDA